MRPSAKTATVWSPPLLMERTPIPETKTGSELLLPVIAFPSCPELLSPQQSAVKVLPKTAQVCDPPADNCGTSVRISVPSEFLTGKAIDVSTKLPRPNWPLALCPQQYANPLTRAHVWL